jgi:hypothetical protein
MRGIADEKRVARDQSGDGAIGCSSDAHRLDKRFGHDTSAEKARAGRGLADAESAALVRLGKMDELAVAMIEKQHFQAWCARAPWAIFGPAPLVFLAAGYFVACTYLWSVWRTFLAGADTPFGHPNHGPIYGFQNICLRAGKFYYLGVPILVGWGVALIVALQRSKGLWPIVGSALVAIMGGASQVYASRTAVPGGLGHIRMDFVASVQDLYFRIFYAGVISSFTVLPYLIWRLGFGPVVRYNRGGMNVVSTTSRCRIVTEAECLEASARQ